MPVNIGEAVGMSTILPSDQGRLFSSIIGRNKAQSERQRALKTKSSDLVKIEDFNKNYSAWNIPALADKEAEEYMQLTNKFAGLRENDINGINQLTRDIAVFKQNQAKRRSFDTQFGKYADDPNLLKNNEFIKIARDASSGWEKVFQAGSKLKNEGILITEEGFGGIAPTVNYTPKLDFKAEDYDEVIATDSKGNPIIEQAGRNGDFYYVKKKVLKDEPKQLAFEILTQKDPKWHDVLTYGLDDATLSNTTAVQNKIAEESRKLIQAQEEGGYRLDLRAPYRPPQESEASKKSKPKVSGNSVTLGNAKWSYFADGKEEIFTPSRTDVTENKVFDFEKIVSGGKTEIVSGRLKEIVIGKDNKVMINVIEVRDGEDRGETSVQYTPNNIGKIKNEFNANPYEIRAMFTGSPANVPSGSAVGTTAKGTGSNVNKRGLKSESKTRKYSATNPETDEKIFSDDGITWFDTKGNKIQ